MELNPGLIYILGSGGLYLIKDRLRTKLAALVSLSALIYIYCLPLTASGAKVAWLDFNLVLFSVDRVSKFIGLSFAVFSLASLIYSADSVTKKYYVFGYLYVGASVGILFVGDLVSFYIAWELMTITSYFLIFDPQKTITDQTSYQYFIIHLLGALSLLWAVLLHYEATGSLLLARLDYGVYFVFLAVGIKLAFIGLHSWLPQNYATTSFPVSVLLSAYTTKVGVYALYRLLGAGDLILYAGVVSALGGVIFALLQTDIRKLLSYHLISQVGYMVAGIGLGTKLGRVGAFFHLGNNILYKGLLFMVAGVLIYSTGNSDLKKLGGLATVLPWTAVCGLVAALAIAGLPPLNGYLSKLLLKKGSSDFFVHSGLKLASFATSLSFLKLIYLAFFKAREKPAELIERRPLPSMRAGMGLLAGLIILISLNPELVTGLLALNKSIDYYRLANLWAGFRPALTAGFIFWAGREIIIHQLPSLPEVEVYTYPFRGLDYLSRQLSRLHNGSLRRYLLWLISGLVFLLLLKL